MAAQLRRARAIAVPGLSETPGKPSHEIAQGMPSLWLQEGVVDQATAETARAAGILTVMDRCVLKARPAMGS